MRGEAGITVAEAMALPCFSGARIIAGQGGRDRLIRSVNMMEVPDIGRYVLPGELLVTTAYPLRQDPEALARLVPLLVERALACLALKPNRYIDAIPEAMISTADRLEFPLIELPPNASFNDILAGVLGTILNRQALQLERSQAIHEQLSDVAIRGGSLSDLARVLTRLIGHSVSISDSQGQTLTSAGPRRTGQDDKASARVTRDIRSGRSHLGQVIVVSNEPLDQEAMVAIEHGATVAALQMVQARAAATRNLRYRAAIGNELVSGHPTDRQALLDTAAVLGWDLHLPRCAVVTCLVDAHSRKMLSVASTGIEDELLQAVDAAFGPSAIAWGLHTQLAILATSSAADVDDRIRLARTVQEEIRRRLPHLLVSVATGCTVTDPSNLHQTYQEAQDAMVVGRALYTPGFCVRYDDLGFYRLLFEVPTERLERYCDDILGPLLEYDRRRNGSLVKTLDVYLGCGCNSARAARQLYVHYNTLRYRLSQIKLLTGPLDGYRARRLTLEVALQAREVVTSRSRNLNVGPMDGARAAEHTQAQR